MRNLDDDLVARLRRRAAELGCSAEEAHREILRRALRDDNDAFARRLREIPDVGVGADFERHGDLPRDVEL
ncbi:MAG: DNA-binding protein [Actinomycetota bacterium]